MRRKAIKVYISHTSGDKKIAIAVANELQKRGIDVWSDEKSLLLGKDLAAATKRAMESSDAIIAILNKHSYSSSRVRGELEQALFNEKYKDKFLPVLIGKDKEKFPRLPWVLSKLYHLHLSPDSPTSISSKKIVSAFLNHLSRGQAAHDS